jgi:hypothetical protein
MDTDNRRLGGNLAAGERQPNEYDLLETPMLKSNICWATIRGGCETSMTPSDVVGVADRVAAATIQKST